MMRSIQHMKTEKRIKKEKVDGMRMRDSRE